MVYQWKTGSRHKADPTKAAEVMNRLADEGRLNASDLVEESRPEDAPLHGEFEWNDTTAAEKWRQHQARNIINALVVYDENEPQREPIRVYFNIEQRESEYTPTEVLIRTVDGKTALKDLAWKELRAFQNKYQTILEWCEVDQLVSEVVASLGKDPQ